MPEISPDSFKPRIDSHVGNPVIAPDDDQRNINDPILESFDPKLGSLILTRAVGYGMAMHVITKGTLQAYWERPGREDAEEPLKAWCAEAKAATWTTPTDIKALYGNASFVADNRVIFNIGGNKHRLVVHVNYEQKVVLIKFVGSHAEYDAIDAAKVGGGRK